MTEADLIRRQLASDGLFTQQIRRHSLEKILLHNYYITLFSSAMKDRWPQRAYVGLYSGAGRAEVIETGEIVETTALGPLRLKYPFTKHIFVDSDPQCTSALSARVSAIPGKHDVSYITKDVASALPDILREMPSYSAKAGLLSFCFIDPFSAALDFQVIKTLGTRYKMDFLVLLMLGRDVRTNFLQYYENPSDHRIAALIDDPHWRDEWAAQKYDRKDLLRFVLEKFDGAMRRIGYTASRPDDAHPIRVMGKHVLLYFLVLYSKNSLGRQFWRATRLGTSPQLGLSLNG